MEELRMQLEQIKEEMKSRLRNMEDDTTIDYSILENELHDCEDAIIAVKVEDMEKLGEIMRSTTSEEIYVAVSSLAPVR